MTFATRAGLLFSTAPSDGALRWRRNVFCCCLSLLCLNFPAATADITDQTTNGKGNKLHADVTAVKHHSSPESDSSSTSDKKDTAENRAPTREQRLKATIGLYLLYGIVGLGVALVGFTIWWGSLVKRDLRKPLPPAARGDELWYLRKEHPHTNGETYQDGTPSTGQTDESSDEEPAD